MLLGCTVAVTMDVHMYGGNCIRASFYATNVCMHAVCMYVFMYIQWRLITDQFFKISFDLEVKKQNTHGHNAHWHRGLNNYILCLVFGLEKIGHGHGWIWGRMGWILSSIQYRGYRQIIHQLCLDIRIHVLFSFLPSISLQYLLSFKFLFFFSLQSQIVYGLCYINCKTQRG